MASRTPKGRAHPTRRVRRAPALLAAALLLAAAARADGDATPGGAAEAEPGAARAGGLALSEALAAALADGETAQIAGLEAERAVDIAGQERSAYLPRASITSNAG